MIDLWEPENISSLKRRTPSWLEGTCADRACCRATEGAHQALPAAPTSHTVTNRLHLQQKQTECSSLHLFKIFPEESFPLQKLSSSFYFSDGREIFQTDRWHIPSRGSGVKTCFFWIILQINKCPLCPTQLILSRFKCHRQIMQLFHSDGLPFLGGGGEIDLKLEGIPLWDKCWNWTFRLSSSISFNLKTRSISSVFYFLVPKT